MECVKTSQNCRSPAALICCKPQIQIQLQMAPITLQPTQCVSQHLNMFTINIYKKMTCTCKVKSIKSNIANGLSKNQIWKVLVNCLNPNLNPIRKPMKNKEALKQWRLQEEVEDGPHQRFISNPRKNQAAVWRMPISGKKNSLPISTRPPTKIAAALKVTSATRKQPTITSATKKQSTISKSTVSKTRYFLKQISPLINLSNKKETKPLHTIEYLLKTLRKHVLIEKCC